MLQTGHTVQHHALHRSVWTEGIEAVFQPGRLDDFALLMNRDIAVIQFAQVMHRGGFQEVDVLTGQVTRPPGHRYFLGQVGAQAVGAGHDDAVVYAQFQEGVANRVNLR